MLVDLGRATNLDTPCVFNVLHLIATVLNFIFETMIET